MLMTALVAIFGISGTAVAAKRLVTGADIKNGSITGVDLSKSTQDALRGKKGAAGVTGARGFKGVGGAEARRARRARRASAVSQAEVAHRAALERTGEMAQPARTARMGRPERTAARVRWAVKAATGPRAARHDRRSGRTGTTGGQGITGTTGPQGVPAVRYFAAIAQRVSSRVPVACIVSASGTNGSAFDVKSTIAGADALDVRRDSASRPRRRPGPWIRLRDV